MSNYDDFFLDPRDASNLNKGTVPVDRIPDLDADKITSGILASARIPSLNASKINAGTFSVARIPTIPLSKISDSGALAALDSVGSAQIAAGAVLESKFPAVVSGANYTHLLQPHENSHNSNSTIIFPELQIVVPKTGTYQVVFFHRTQNGTDISAFTLFKNAATSYAGFVSLGVGSGNTTATSYTKNTQTITLNAGDIIAVFGIRTGANTVFAKDFSLNSNTKLFG